MLKIKNNVIYNRKGRRIKNIFCPLPPSELELERISEHALFCKGCSKELVDTKFLSAEGIENIIERDQAVCLKISKRNPIFSFE